MKKYPKSINCDERGQLVIPKDIRSDLGLDDGSGLFLYLIEGEGILLKKVESPALDAHHEILNEIEIKADKLGIRKDNLKKSIKNYEKVTEGRLELI